MLRGLVLGVFLLAPAGVWADEVSALEWVKVAEPAFKAGTYGPGFVVMGKTEGCFDEEGFQICSVVGEGLHFQSAYGSVTPEAVLDFLGRLPVGTEVLLSGDVVNEVGDRVDAVFSYVLPPM